MAGLPFAPPFVPVPAPGTVGSPTDDPVPLLFVLLALHAAPTASTRLAHHKFFMIHLHQAGIATRDSYPPPPCACGRTQHHHTISQ
jgi:hypothetical protein